MEEVPTTPTKQFKTLEFYRKLIQIYSERQDYGSASFWANKAITFSGGAQQDVFAQAQCLSLSGQYFRAAAIIILHNYERTNLYFRCLTARCFYMAKEYSRALDVLDLENTNVRPGQTIRPSKWEPSDHHQSISGHTFLLRGKIYEALMNRTLAAQNFEEALKHDVYCVEAFQLLTQHHMLSRADEVATFERIPFSRYCTNSDTELVKCLYSLKIKQNPFQRDLVAVSYPVLKKNVDVLSAEAEKLYYSCDYQGAHRVALQVFQEDTFHDGCLPIYVACLVELKRPSELFKLSHKLIEVMPDAALAWYAVGSYYYLIGKQEQARRNLNKALCIDPVFGPAWLLFGHSFATESEHDQAMAAYFKATQLMKGSHLPMLHVGLECGISNNPQLAMKFLHEAEYLAPRDPYITHEMGVVKFNEKKYGEALCLFLETLAFIKSPKSHVMLETWEPLYNNIGHASRKMKRYEEAYHYHRRALVLCPSNASTHAAIGLLHAVTGKTELAIESFHKSLSLRREDTFSNTMLRHVIEKMVEESNGDSYSKLNPLTEEIDGSEYPRPKVSKRYEQMHSKSENPLKSSQEIGGSSSYVEWLQHTQGLMQKHRGSSRSSATRGLYKSPARGNTILQDDDSPMEYDDYASSDCSY